MRRALAILVFLSFSAGFADTGASSTLDEVDETELHRKRERDAEYDEHTGRPEWNPLAGPIEALRDVLFRAGIGFEFDAAIFSETASETGDGHRHFGTLAWDLVGDWRLRRDATFGSTSLEWDFLGSTGFDYDSNNAKIGADLGPAHSLNANIVTDDFVVNEMFFRQVLPGDGLTLQAGRIDLSSWFDTNRAANDAFRQFFAFAFENNPSIPWAQYGGLGAVVRTELGEDVYAIAGFADSSSDEPFTFWETADDDWYGLFEIGVATDIPVLGAGNVLVTPWINRLAGKTGGGISMNLDQELGFERLVGFVRAGWGDEDVTPIEVFVSGGLLLERPIGRRADTLGVAVAWSNPSAGSGLRNETLVEVFYEIGITSTISLSPDIQILIHPARTRAHDVLLVGGVRVGISF